jgi:hypothetical protein
MDELRSYLDPTVIVAFRHTNFTDLPANIKRVIYPMRICKESDFSESGFNVTPAFLKKLKYRLCPDIPNDDHYKVHNLYQNQQERVSFSI